jgi:hypothetical protein
VSIVFSNWTTARNIVQLEDGAQHHSYGQCVEVSPRLETTLPPLSGAVKEHPTPLDWSGLWEHFLRAHVPSRTSNVLEYSPARAVSLWQSLGQLGRSSTLLQHTLAAIASVRIGKIESNYTLYESSRQLYISAVSSLRQRLSDERESTSIDVIATIMALAAYEVRPFVL